MTPSDIASKPAFPVQTLTLTQDGNYRDLSAYGDTRQPGLTFRQLAAIHIHAALLTDPARARYTNADDTAQTTRQHVDALIAELAKNPS